MSTFLDIHKNLYFHRFDICIKAEKETFFNFWPGSIIRNNFLSAASSVKINLHNSDLHLRELINQIPLSASHPLYKEMVDGFPKGYYFACPQYSFDTIDSSVLKKGDTITFSLYLVGHFSKYYMYFFEAIRIMCKNGLGHPKSPFILESIYECSFDGELHLMVNDKSVMAGKLLFPVAFSDFLSIQIPSNKTKLCIDFLTPVNLFRKKEKKEKQLSYQDKCNGFPSLYQLVRSVAYRMAKMSILYVYPDKPDIGTTIMDSIEEYIEHATKQTLISVDMQYINLRNTPKKETENKMPLQGYVGRQVYDGSFDRYFPMLKYMEEMGVGHEVVYGLGRYRVEVGSKK